ncbi:MAG: YicC family protein [Bacteriovoracaceae bacterium]|nr:YicC family protein [Bacteriovoracaceae bacterium]
MTMQSMTGQGRGEQQNHAYRVTAEIKSVNHRFRDFRFRMPSSLSSLEIAWRQQLQNQIGRGAFEVAVNVQSLQDAMGNLVDLSKVQTFVKHLQSILADTGVAVTAEVSNFLRPEFAPDASASDALLFDLAQQAFHTALQKLKQNREEEGQKLQQILAQHLAQYAQDFQEVRRLALDFRPQAQEKLKKAWAEAKTELAVDEARFNQELIYYLEKWDIAEEIQRIALHLQQMEQVLAKGGEVGRTIEFLLQELHRETNTIGSKSMLGEISSRVVSMKVSLERIREQTANLA